MFLVLTAGVIYSFANQQVDQNTEETMNSLMAQKTEYISSLYQDLFVQFYALTNDNATQTLLNQNIISGEDYLDLSDEVDGFYYRNASLIDSIYININDYYEITIGDEENLNSPLEVEKLFHPEVPEREGYFWLNNHSDFIFNPDQEVQTLVYYDKNNTDTIESLFAVNIRTSAIDSILTELSMDGSYMMLVSPEGYHVPKDAPSIEPLNTQIYALYTEEGLDQPIQEMTVNQSGSYNVRRSTIGTNKFELILVTPSRSLLTRDNGIPIVFFILFLILALIIIVIVQLIQKHISKPIETLANRMRTTESYDEKLSPSNDVPQELGILYDTYNTLTERNTRLVNQMEIEQEQKLELELALLHAQISPHFLYNTLYSIKGLVDLNMNEEASEMVLNLSDFLRTSLSRGREVITIEEELTNIKSYLFMMHMRYGDYFDYEINVPKHLYSYLIVKLTLQPLVENAINHGVMHSRNQGRIIIGSEELEEDLILYVKDNGRGLSPEKLRKIKEEFSVPYLSEQREETGIGLRSVDIRIKNRYGNDYGVDIESVENEFTKVSVRLPKIKGEDESV